MPALSKDVLAAFLFAALSWNAHASGTPNSEGMAVNLGPSRISKTPGTSSSTTSSGSRLALMSSGAVSSGLPEAGTTRFAVLGDDRLRLPMEGGIRKGFDNPRSGICEGVLGPMLDEIFKQKPDFVLFTGDLVCGWNRDQNLKFQTPDLDLQLHAWVAFVQQHDPENVPVFVVRGNHETRTAHGDPAIAWAKVDAFNRAEGAAFARSAGARFQTDGFNLALTFRDTTVIGLDAYQSGDTVANTAWVKGALEGHKEQVFAFSHPMCFKAGRHTDYLADKNRDELLDMLVGAGCKWFFAGHDHLMDTVSATTDAWKGQSITQIVAGTAGAPFYETKNAPLPTSEWRAASGAYALTRGDHVENRFGYLMVTVGPDGTKVDTVEFDVPGVKNPRGMAVLRGG